MLIYFGCRGTETFLNVFNENCFLSQLWKQPQLCPCKVSHFKILVAFAIAMSKLKRKSLGFILFITWTAFRNRPGTANFQPQSIKKPKHIKQSAKVEVVFNLNYELTDASWSQFNVPNPNSSSKTFSRAITLKSCIWKTRKKEVRKGKVGRK